MRFFHERSGCSKQNILTSAKMKFNYIRDLFHYHRNFFTLFLKHSSAVPKLSHRIAILIVAIVGLVCEVRNVTLFSVMIFGHPVPRYTSLGLLNQFIFVIFCILYLVCRPKLDKTSAAKN